MPKLSLLDKRDLDDLAESGITPETAEANGLHTAHHALRFPYRNLKAKVNGFARWKPHKPRVGKDGKAVKYEQPKGSPLRAYFPDASVPKLNDGESPIFITEGEKKALALSQLDLAAVGIGGIWSGCKPPRTDELIDDLAEIDWDGRDIYIVFDYDAKPDTREQGRLAARRLAKALRAAGSNEVYNIVLPPGPNDLRQGVDDFLVAHGAEAFRNLVDGAEPVASEKARKNVIKIIPVSTPELSDAARIGLVGDFLRAVGPYTEATEAGILAHLLPAIGTLIGPNLYMWAGTKQPARINTVVVGPTNAGRKGTSFAPVDLLLSRVDAEFWNCQRVNGLSSGEGLIAYVADREEKDADGNRVVVAVEKRLYVIEEEFSRVLAQIRRDGNILSQIIRNCYDNGNLATLTVNPRRASGAHISIVGHITPEELTERLDHIEMANGFGSRFLWFLVRSDKIMPRTKPIPNKLFLPFEKQLRSLYFQELRTKQRVVELDACAMTRWECLYRELREDRPGLAGAMIARGSSMVLRIALIYAVLEASKDSPPRIKVEHLEAALAVWAYCVASAMTLFDSQTGDKLCDKILQLLSSGPMTKDDFNRHLSAKQKNEVVRALERLQNLNLVRKSQSKREGAGRPATVWERVAS